MIEFIDVTKKYNEKYALKDVNLKIDKGEFVYLIGHSGAGKSTFFNLLLKIVEPDKGKIVFGDYVVNELPNRLIPVHRRKMGIVYQNFSLLPKKTIAENIEFGMRIIGGSKSKIRSKVPQILTLVGLKDKMENYPDELSIGEQQRVAIARAIVNNPEVLIADEPTGNLDPVTGWEIMTLLEQINNRGTTVVMITHSQDIVNSMPKRVVTLSNGEVISDEKGKYKVDKFKNIPIEVSDEIKQKSEVYKKSTGNLKDIKIIKPEEKTSESNNLNKTKKISAITPNKSNTVKINNNKNQNKNTKTGALSFDQELELRLKKSKMTLNKKLKDIEKITNTPKIDFNSMEDFLGIEKNVKPLSEPLNKSNTSKTKDDIRNLKEKRDIKELNSKTIEELKNNNLDELINNAVDIDPFNVSEIFKENTKPKKVEDDTLTIIEDTKDNNSSGSSNNNKYNEEK